MAVSPKALIDKLNGTSKKALEQAIALCMSRTHFNVELEHWLLKLLDGTSSDLTFILRQYAIDANKVKRELEASLNNFKTGNGRPPALATEVLDAIREAWVFGSLDQGSHKVRSGHLLAAILADSVMGNGLKNSSPELGRISLEKLQADMKDLLPRVASEENEQEAAAAAVAGPSAGPSSGPASAGGGKTPALDQFTVNLTANAKAGKIDPVVGRDSEIRQVIDILTRRRQNNPILTGEAGVGKTAVVEGLALRINGGDVPDPLKNVQLHTLDLGLLQAGAGVKGEFENRLKSVIDEVKRSAVPIILFIDEAHTLIGAGGAAGQNDAANLLKPALARGELRTIAATTFAEYKKYFETDAALKRRFQQVKVDEPDEQKAVRMLRGLVPMLEKHHKVRILDEAVGAKIIGSYVNSAFAKSEAMQNGFDEAIMLTHEGHVSEGSAENIFLISNGEIATPATTENILIGVTRDTVMQLAQRELGRVTQERVIDRTELYTADEIFLCGTGAQIAPVIEVDRRPVGTGAVGPISAAIQRLYDDIVRGRHPEYSPNWCTPIYITASTTADTHNVPEHSEV